MATQFRTTPCGMLLRLLSGHKLLRYPDEIDPTLANQFAYRHEEPNPRKADSEMHQIGPADMSENQTPEKKKTNVDSAVNVVDWYGPADPEVSF
jgi:MFS transporter, DHA1 family, multidrug resistance protein